jgi:hypothetical protein
MKSTGTIFGIIVLMTVIVIMAASCGVSAPSGTYSYTEVPSWTITFGNGSFTMFVPASVSPSGENITAGGVFTVSGKTLLLTGLDQPMSFTITNSKTLKESDGSVWKKQ